MPGLRRGLSSGSDPFNPEEYQCIKGTDDTLINLNPNAMNKTSGGRCLEIYLSLGAQKEQNSCESVSLDLIYREQKKKKMNPSQKCLQSWECTPQNEPCVLTQATFRNGRANFG